MTRILIDPDRWYGWGDVTVEVETAPPIPGSARTYAVFVDGEHVGYVASQKEGRSYYWGGLTLAAYKAKERLVYGTNSRKSALSNLVITAKVAAR